MATATPVTEGPIRPNYIGGQWVESRSGQKVERRNPANSGKLLGYTPVSNREEMREAITAAVRACPVWRDTRRPSPARSCCRRRACDMVSHVTLLPATGQ